MYQIDMEQMSAEFGECWNAAGQFIQNTYLSKLDGQFQTWLKATPAPPFLEHFSFRVGNQLFFVRVVDVDNYVQGPSSTEGLEYIADQAGGHACLLQMKNEQGKWQAAFPDKGLISLETDQAIIPDDISSNELIEMTDWELHDFSIQIVKGFISQTLKKDIISSHSNPEISPSIWFEGKDGPEFVVVRSARYPDNAEQLPANLEMIKKDCATMSETGHFAPVAISTTEQKNSPNEIMPLFRGKEMYVRFEGLRAL